MRAVTPPDFNVIPVFEACASTIEDATLKSRVESIAPQLTQAELIYDWAGTEGLLFSLQGTGGVSDLVTKEEMIWMYDNRLSRKGTPARPFYDRLKAMPVRGVCPFCCHRPVATLDHVLAKTTHPIYSITPLNLVGCCSDCNKAKLNRMARSASDQPFHPYYDNIDTEIWLKAAVTEEIPPAVVFSVDPPPFWPAEKKGRLGLHFNTFGLRELYASNSATELANNAQVWNEMADSGGPDELRQHLARVARSCIANQRNSWQSALYAALAISSWFYGRGHRHILV
jgi:hypothetical protein